MTTGGNNVRRGDWIATGIVTVVYFGFMLMVSFAPEWAAAPVAPGTPVSVALVLGIGVAMGTVVLAACYTHWRNRDESSNDSDASRPQ